ncbi:MAG: PASTA domain-containing protein, partial [Lentihominibacter sp.]
VNISKGLGDGDVPDLTGKMQDELASYLEAAGFTLGSVTEEASEEEAGTVLRQDPKAGSTAEKGTAINVVVSDGSKAKAVVPYLVGKSLGDAQAALLNAGLSVGSISYDYSSTYAEGEVMWQQYDANAQLDKGTSVKIRVSKGNKPEETTAPTEPSKDDEDEE